MEQTALEAGPLELTAHRRSLPALTGLRFFAAYYVVVFHTRISMALLAGGHAAAGYFFESGYLAVPLFFLLSGFILAYTYEGQIAAGGARRRFWEARFARIWPVYALSLLLSSLPALNFPPASEMLAALFMVQAWNPLRPSLAGTWNPVCWTLSVEAVFYICFPWVQAWIQRRRSSGQAVFIGAMLLLGIAANVGAYGFGRPAPGILHLVPMPVLHLPEFFIGVGLGNVFIRRLSLANVRAGHPVLPGAGLWTYGSALLTLALLCREPGHWTSIILVGFAALIFGLAAERTLLSRLLSTRLLVLGGGASYSVYLMQMPVKRWVALLASGMHILSESTRMLLTAVVLLLISLLLFRFVEDPARRFFRGIFARLEDRRKSAARRTAALS